MKKYITPFLVIIFLMALTSCSKSNSAPLCEQGGEEVPVQSNKTE